LLNGRLMVVSCEDTHQLRVYRTEDGSHVRTLGGPGTGPGMFESPCSLCVTARDTVLVVERANNRVQEVTPDGKHVRFIPVNRAPEQVAVYGDVVAVLAPECIGLYSYTTGALVRAIQVLGLHARTARTARICFAPDGKHLAVSMRGHPNQLISMDGDSARHLGPMEACTIVAFTCTGDVIGVNERGVIHVFSATDGVLLRSWTAKKNRMGLTVSGNRLYVLHYKTMQVFE